MQKQFWFIINGEQSGPYSLDQAEQLPFIPQSPAWCTGYTQWVTARQIPELAEILEQRRLYDPNEGWNSPNAWKPQPEPGKTVPEAPEDETAVVEVTAETEQSGLVGQPEPQAGTEQLKPGHEAEVRDSRPEPAYHASCQTYSEPFHPAPQQPEASIGERPSTYLVWSIISTILCCVPVGILAIIFSVKAGRKADDGDYEGARKYAEIAQWFVIATITLGVLWGPFSMILAAL